MMALREWFATIICRPQKEQKESNQSLEEKFMQIPLELLVEIMCRLEVSDLLKLKCVCKSWLQLISSPEFIQMHKNRSRTLIYLTLPHVIIDYENSHETFYWWQITKRIPNPSGFSKSRMEIMGSCDGLVCLLNINCQKIVIFNPSIRKSTSFDISEWSEVAFYWFGRHPCTDEYTLVIGKPNKIQVRKLYRDRNLSSLVSVDQEIHRVYRIFEKIGTLFHGSIHWPAFCKAADNGVQQRILTYNFRDNKISEILIPCESVSTLGVLNGCLVAIGINSNVLEFELWVMKDYGLKESWSMHERICGFASFGTLRFSCLGFSSNGDVLIDVPGNFLTKYSLKDKKAILFQHHACGKSRAIAFKDTLVSPDFCDRMI